MLRGRFVSITEEKREKKDIKSSFEFHRQLFCLFLFRSHPLKPPFSRVDKQKTEKKKSNKGCKLSNCEYDDDDVLNPISFSDMLLLSRFWRQKGEKNVQTEQTTDGEREQNYFSFRGCFLSRKKLLARILKGGKRFFSLSRRFSCYGCEKRKKNERRKSVFGFSLYVYPFCEEV